MTKQQTALAVGGMTILAAGIITAILAAPPTLPTYNVPSSYLSSGGVSSNQCAGVTTWTDANNLYEGFTEAGNPHSGTFTITYVPSGATTAAIAYNASASTIATDVAALNASLSGVTATSYSLMPQTFSGNGPLNTNDVWLSGISALSAGVGTQVLTVNDSGIVSGSVKVHGAGLIDLLRSLATSTQVNFATDGCYEVNGGLKFTQADPTLSIDGNPSSTSGEDAYLYDACTPPERTAFPCQYSDQVGNPGLGPILTLTYPFPGTSDPSTVEHLQLYGSSGGIYDSTGAAASGILLLGTNLTVINDVTVEDVWGDCLTLQPDAAHYSYRVTNLIVENFDGQQCGRQGISPISVDQATFCGTTIGQTGEPSSWDFENDTTGANQGAEYVTITGLPCDWGGVTSQGCSFKGSFNVSTNPAQSGPVLVQDCVQPSLSFTAEGGLKIASESSTSSTVPNGAWTFVQDQFKCFASIYGPCFHVGAPFTASLRSSILEVGTNASNTQYAWESSDTAIGGITYGANIFFASDCIAGFIGNLAGTPPGGLITGTLSTFQAVNTPYPPATTTGYFEGSKTLCTVVP